MFTLLCSQYIHYLVSNLFSVDARRSPNLGVAESSKYVGLAVSVLNSTATKALTKSQDQLGACPVCTCKVELDINTSTKVTCINFDDLALPCYWVQGDMTGIIVQEILFALS